MNRVVRGICAISFGFLFAACGAGSDSGSESGASPADRPMKSAMATCVGVWVDEGGALGLNNADLNELKPASKTVLEQCGSERILDRGIGSGYACNTDGCYTDDGHGFDWTDAAREWACANNRPELCDSDK